MPQVGEVSLASPKTAQLPDQGDPAHQSRLAQLPVTPAPAASATRAHPRRMQAHTPPGRRSSRSGSPS
eukprot:8447054-Heterocapsa_arctica.AAC.1